MSAESDEDARAPIRQRERYVYGSFTDARGQHVEVVHYRSPSGFIEALRAEWTVGGKTYHSTMSIAVAAERLVDGVNAVWNDSQLGGSQLDNAVSDRINEPFGDYLRYIKPSRHA